MTNDYKKDILDYITNNVSVTNGSNVPLFNDTKTIDVSISEQIKTTLGESYIFSGYLYDQTTQIIIIYGYISTGGFLYLMDKNLNEISAITEWNTGTKLFKFE